MPNDRVVVITGAASGIGLGTARRFVKDGATVVAADYSEETLQQAANELGKAYVPKLCDVSSEPQVALLANYVSDKFQRVDVLVNNAGRARAGVTPENFRDEDFSFHYDVLIKGPMLMVKHFVPLLRASSCPSIVNISSCGALSEPMRDSGDFLYGTAKAALVKFNRHLVRSYPGIRSNVIFPGLIDTPMYSKAMGLPREAVEMLFESVKQRIAVGRVGKPEDIANCIFFLASEEASFIHGAEITVDGGQLIYGVDLGF